MEAVDRHAPWVLSAFGLPGLPARRAAPDPAWPRWPSSGQPSSHGQGDSEAGRATGAEDSGMVGMGRQYASAQTAGALGIFVLCAGAWTVLRRDHHRSEEHTSELQS